MAIDVTPNTVATSALQALDFSSLIGGPMDAIVKAQALAAQTAYQFINEVCLTVDPITKQKKPINVTFTYNNNGQEATLTVPLLVILTIPNIEVSEFTIDFIANISAASSSISETSTDTDLGVEAEAEASLGVGPFSIKVKAKANYSSKQHSKAAQDSKYSVEYTMNVQVKGGQSPMPSGLQTVLNILQGSATSINLDDLATVSPAYLDIVQTDNVGNIHVTVKNKQGMLVKSGKVNISIPDEERATTPFTKFEIVRGSKPDALMVEAKKLASGEPLSMNKDLVLSYMYMNDDPSPPPVDPLKVTACTDRNGVVIFKPFLLDLPDGLKGKNLQGIIKIQAAIPLPDSSTIEVEHIDYNYTILETEQNTEEFSSAKLTRKSKAKTEIEES